MLKKQLLNPFSQFTSNCDDLRIDTEKLVDQGFANDLVLMGDDAEVTNSDWSAKRQGK